MSTLFSDSIIDEIRDKCNIAEIVSGYIPLKRAGRNFKALCPFHQEKTPSFMVSPDKGIFHCFGCGAGGNVFNFIMKYEGLEFPQVVRMLAEKTGVRLPSRSMFVKEEKATRDLFQINEMAASWYQENLKKEFGRVALEYLKKRDFQAKTILTFRLGFAPANNGLLSFMRGKGIPEALLEKAGLILCREGGAYYDRFKQRIIFPIFDSRGRVLGFGGRVLDNSDAPKYMNSPETPVYSKGNHLYGLNFTKEEIKKQDFCIIVEGYVDLLTVYQNNIVNVVASLGTALTLGQIRLLKRYSHNVVMIFDADRAGELASLRSLDLLIEEDVTVKVVSLPKNEDPDAFLRKFGKKGFWQKISEARDLFDYKLHLLSKSYDLDTVEGKVGIANFMLPTIRRVQNTIRRSGYVKRLAQEFSRGERSLGEEWILAELKKVKKDFEYHSQKSLPRHKVGIIRPAEEMLLKILLEDQDAIDEIKRHLTLEDFRDLRIREAMRVVYRLQTEPKAICPDKLISYLGSEEAAQLISRISSCAREFIDREKSLKDCIRRIKADNFKDRLNKLQREIKLAQGWGHKDKVTQLVSEYSRLIKTKGVEKWENKKELAKKAG
ncbi:MAG: DNA primase [Candidatus Omnitrophica bacterium]|nr:DNA primase [Candidatus Omnitrophota bacterium]